MPRKVLFVLALVLASYGYGVATGRMRLFPHDVIAPVYARIVGLFADAPDEVRQIERRPGLWHVAQRDHCDAQTVLWSWSAEMRGTPFDRPAIRRQDTNDG